MLEYREFPIKTAVFYLLQAFSLAYYLRVIFQMIRGEIVSESLGSIGLLGLGFATAAVLVFVSGFVADRLRKNEIIILLCGIVPPLLGLLVQILGSPSFLSPYIEMIWIFSVTCGLVFLIINWTVMLNRTVVVRFRGRISAIFIVLILSIFTLYNLIENAGLLSVGIFRFLPELLTIMIVSSTASFRSWRWGRYPLAVHGNFKGYFVPLFFLLAAHILWFYGTYLDILAEFIVAGRGGEFISLGQYTGLTLYEPIFLAIGALFSGSLSDIRGRKTVFSSSVFMLGMLAIFSSTLYGTYAGSFYFYAELLLFFERFVEGFILGFAVLLIWTELGSPKDKGKRMAFVLLFFMGYAILFIGLELRVFGLFPPEEIVLFGSQVAVVLSLVALYLSGNVPEILGREIEMEELELEFDEKLVEETVDAFVGQEDFDSIKSQVDIIDTTQDLSDKDLSDILGEDFQEMLPMRRIPGIGPKLEESLKKAGYKSAAQLAGENAARLSSKIDGLSKQRAEKILADARELVKQTLKKGTSQS